MKRLSELVESQAILDYIKLNFKKNIKTYQEVKQNKKEYSQFLLWFNKSCKPFKLEKQIDNNYSVLLDYEFFNYDWEYGIYKKTYIGNGYDYQDVFKKYLFSNFPYLKQDIIFHSENNIFCAYCKSKEIAEFVIYNLSLLYSNKKKMCKLIKEDGCSKDYNIMFKFKIKKIFKKIKIIDYENNNLKFKIQNYSQSNYLKLLILDMEENTTFNEITVNLPNIKIKETEGFLNPIYNNDWYNIIPLLKQHGIIKQSYGFIKYNMEKYEYVNFDLEKIKEYNKAILV